MTVHILKKSLYTSQSCNQLTFYHVLFMYLFSWHLPLPQFARCMFHCCGKCQYPCFPAHFSFVCSRACRSKQNYSPVAGAESMWRTDTDKERMSDISVSCPVAVGCCDMYTIYIKSSVLTKLQRKLSFYLDLNILPWIKKKYVPFLDVFMILHDK